MDGSALTANKVLAIWCMTWRNKTKVDCDDEDFRERFVASPEAQRLAEHPYALVVDAIRNSYRLADAETWIETELSKGTRSLTCVHGEPRGSCAACRTTAEAVKDRSHPFGSHNVSAPPTGGIAERF